MLAYYRTALFSVLLLVLPAVAFTEVSIPQLSGSVVDTTGVLGPEQQVLEQQLNQLKAETGSEIVVLVISSTQPEEIEQFSIRVADQWKIGRKGIDDGAILLVALSDRRVRIEVGRGFEGVLPDIKANRIIQEQIIPHFKENDFTGGIEAGINAMMLLARGADLPEPSLPPSNNSNPNIIVTIIILFIAGNILAAILGTFLGATGTGLLGFGASSLLSLASFPVSLGIGIIVAVMVLFRNQILSILFQMANSSGGFRGGPWSGGGSGGGGGGFGSGGTFSGGGASGRW